MMRSRSLLLAGLALAAGLAISGPAAPVAAESAPLFPTGVMRVLVTGIVVPPIVVVSPLGIGTRHAHVDKDRSHTERADITIGGE
jgi:hypothetical protein